MKKKILVTTIVIVLLFFVVQFAKALYTSNAILDYYFKSKGFYFETDYDKSLNVYNFWDGSDLEYNVANYIGNKITEDNISYEVTCIAPNNAVCKINGSTGKYLSTLNGGEKNDETIYIEVETNQKDIEIEVQTKSTAPYNKTIRNNVLLHKDEDVVGSIDYKLVNYSNYSLLNISNYYNHNKCVKVKWNNPNLRVSVSDVNVSTTDSNGYVNEFTKNISSNDTASIKFYNEGNTTYDEKEFTITECSLES